MWVAVIHAAIRIASGPTGYGLSVDSNSPPPPPPLVFSSQGGSPVARQSFFVLKIIRLCISSHALRRVRISSKKAVEMGIILALPFQKTTVWRTYQSLSPDTQHYPFEKTLMHG